MLLPGDAVKTSKAFLVRDLRNPVLPGRMPEQRCRSALVIVQPEDDEIERMYPRAKHLPGGIP